MCFPIEQLDSYVEKIADEKLAKDIEEHLKTCKACSDEVKERAAFKKFLTQDLGTPDTPHPDFEDIQAFYYKKLANEKAKEVLDHLIYCASCKENFVTVKTAQMIKEGKISVPVELPKKLSPKLETYFIKNRIKEIATEIVNIRFPDKQQFFNAIWEKLSNLPEFILPVPKKADLAGALGFSNLDTGTSESQILKIVSTLGDVLPKVSEKEDVKKVMKKIRTSAKKNKLEPDLIEDLVEITKQYL